MLHSLPITDPACLPLLLSLSVHGCTYGSPAARASETCPFSRVSVVYLICPPFCYPRSHSAEWQGPKEGGSSGFFATVRFAVLDKVEATIAIDQTTAIAFLIAFPPLTMVRSVARTDDRRRRLRCGGGDKPHTVVANFQMPSPALLLVESCLL